MRVFDCSLRLVAAACLAIMGLSGCVGAKRSEERQAPPQSVVQPPAPSAPEVALTLTPRLRVVPELDSVVADVPSEGLERADVVRIPVSAKGTAGGQVEAWLQASGQPIGRTLLAWNAGQTAYEGVLAIPASALSAGTYPVMGVLRIEEDETDPMASSGSVRIVEPTPRGIPPALQGKVAAFRPTFSTNSDLLAARDDEALQQLASELLPYADLIDSVAVQGHCDARGPNSYNDALGERRAATISRALRAFLQDKIVVSAESLGESMADQNAHDDSAWEKDRWAKLQLNQRSAAPNR